MTAAHTPFRSLPDAHPDVSVAVNSGLSRFAWPEASALPQRALTPGGEEAAAAVILGRGRLTRTVRVKRHRFGPSDCRWRPAAPGSSGCRPISFARTAPEVGRGVQATALTGCSPDAHGRGFLFGADGSTALTVSSLSRCSAESTRASAPRLLLSCATDRGPIIGTAPWVPAQAMAT